MRIMRSRSIMKLSEHLMDHTHPSCLLQHHVNWSNYQQCLLLNLCCRYDGDVRPPASPRELHMMTSQHTLYVTYI
ncbi:hypothetical protein DMENIID0001_126870 [Sergentomyia squamirostris]